MRLILNDVDLDLDLDLDLDFDPGPGPGGPPADLDDRALAELYAYPAEGPWLRANMVSTVDGAATGPDGKTGTINNATDKRVFALLRALADVIVVGAGTARVEGYGPPHPVTGPRGFLRDGRAPAPALVVVSRTANVPVKLGAAARTGPGGATGREAEGGTVYLATCEAAGAEALDAARELLGEASVLVMGEGSVDLARLLDHLVELGHRRMLTEGGPHLLRDLASAGLLDELCLTVVPHLLAGAHPRIVTGEAVALELRPRMLLEADGTLLGRWTR